MKNIYVRKKINTSKQNILRHNQLLFRERYGIDALKYPKQFKEFQIWLTYNHY